MKSQAILIGEEVHTLCRKLRFVLSRGFTFEQALYTVATPADVEVLESLIGLANRLGSLPLTDEEQRVQKYIHDSFRPGRPVVMESAE